MSKNKVVQIPKRKGKEEAQITVNPEVVQINPDSPEQVKDRGYSELNIQVRIHGDRAIDVGSDVSMVLDGKPLRGIGKIELSMIPPYFGMCVVNEKEFQESINKAGFFYSVGFVLTKLLMGRSYPALKCAECAENGREGWLRIEYGGLCDNSECQYAHNSVKAKKIEDDLQLQLDI